MSGASGAFQLQEVQDALDERYAEDVDPTPFIHYVPLTENQGTLVGDLSSSTVDGTISGATSQTAWSGFQNGTRDLDGVPRPFGFGDVGYVRMRLIDPVKQVYQYQDTTKAITSFTQKVDRGQALPASVPVGSLQSLFTTSLPVGSSLTFAGHFRFNTGGAEIVPAVRFRTARAGDDETVENAFQFVLGDLHGFGTFVAAGGPNPVAGFYWDGEDKTTIGEAVDEIVSSVSGLWSSNGRNPNNIFGIPSFRFRPVVDPTGAAPTLDILVDPAVIPAGAALVAEDGLRRVGFARARSEVVLEYDRFHGFYSQGEVLPSQDGPLGNQGFTSEFRTVSAPAPQSVLDRFADPDKLVVRTGIRFQADAQDEADRLVALYGQLVEVWECELTGALRRFEGWIGDVVRVEGPLPSFESPGRNFLVVGVRDDADTGGSTLTLWGPRPGTAPV